MARSRLVEQVSAPCCVSERNVFGFSASELGLIVISDAYEPTVFIECSDCESVLSIFLPVKINGLISALH